MSVAANPTLHLAVNRSIATSTYGVFVLMTVGGETDSSCVLAKTDSESEWLIAMAVQVGVPQCIVACWTSARCHRSVSVYRRTQPLLLLLLLLLSIRRSAASATVRCWAPSWASATERPSSARQPAGTRPHVDAFLFYIFCLVSLSWRAPSIRVLVSLLFVTHFYVFTSISRQCYRLQVEVSASADCQVCVLPVLGYVIRIVSNFYCSVQYMQTAH